MPAPAGPTTSRPPSVPARTYHAAAAAAITPLPAAQRHLVNRMSWGHTPELAAEVRAAGGARDWFERQLRPRQLRDPYGDAIDRWFPSLKRSAASIHQRSADDVEPVWEVATDFSRWTVARRLHSRRQVHETMVDFWSNLLNVFLWHDEAQYWRISYDKVIRRHALGTFEDLLRATITHPAMGLYLDNAFSSKEAPNENLGRELLELHTVGVDAGYTEADVKASARMLTGYRVDFWPEFRAYYDTTWHDTKPVKVMGFRHRNGAADGRAATAAYLSYLARHPATARRLAQRLCEKFVADRPSRRIVEAVAAAYRRHGTSIPHTLRAMVDHPDFDRGIGSKVRTPMEDYIAAVRGLGIRLWDPKDDGNAFVRAMYWQYSGAGAAPYEWPAPNGYPEASAAWAGAGRVLTAFEIHQSLGFRWWPTARAGFPDPASMLPRMPATLQQLIDHLALRILGQRAGSPVSRGIALLLDRDLGDRLTREEALNAWNLNGIVCSLLDSPTHLHR